MVINNDNDPPGDQFFPWIEVDQAGRIQIVFLDSRNADQDDDDPNGVFDAYYTYSADGGDTWSEFRLTRTSWNSNGASFIGDYSGMAVAGRRSYPAYFAMDGGDQNIYTNVIVFPGDPDLDGDGAVGVIDLLILLTEWGPCPGQPEPCPADLDNDGAVGIGDLLILLAAWT